MRIAVIPAYEPEEILLDVLEEAYKAGYRIIVVDDGSGVGFSNLFNRAKQYAHVISYPDNKGKGYALKMAFSYIMNVYQGKQTTIVTIDCDGQHRIKDAVRVCEISEMHPHAMILGSRKQSRQCPWKSRFGNGITKKVFFMSTGVKVEDTQTGLRAFDGTLLQMLVNIPGMRYEYEMNMLLKLSKTSVKVIEIPIETVYSENNAGTHFRAMRDSVSIYAEIIKFLLSSVFGFLIDFLFYSLFLFLMGRNAALLANVLARVISSTANFWINYKLVFHSNESMRKSLLKYYALAVCVLVGNSFLLYLLTAIGGCNALLSKLLVEIILFIGNLIIQRTFVFVKGKENKQYG